MSSAGMRKEPLRRRAAGSKLVNADPRKLSGLGATNRTPRIKGAAHFYKGKGKHLSQ